MGLLASPLMMPKRRARLGCRAILPATLLLATLMGWAAMALAQDDRAAERRQMVEEVAALAGLVARETGRAGLSPNVLEALGKVPRHEFVPPAQRASAYRNRPLSIGSGQTISQPFIVALMTDLLALKPEDKVLEVGTGCGYQAAVLAELAKDVYTIEIIESLGKGAAKTLERLGYANVHAKIGDGYKGWPEHAPFDAIIVTAAPDHIPEPLIEQLKPGGRLVIPVGKLFQELMVITKNPDGTTTRKDIVPVQFVPLTRDKNE
jgi:protein-L-isoaspartate(D-aspartate) O-methyltransferase